MSVKRYMHSWEENEMAQYVDGEYVLNSDYAALLARHNALREAVILEIECKEVSLFADGDYLQLSWNGEGELEDISRCARAALDRLLEEE